MHPITHAYCDSALLRTANGGSASQALRYTAMRRGAPRYPAISLDAPLWFPSLAMPCTASHVLCTFADGRRRASGGTGDSERLERLLCLPRGPESWRPDLSEHCPPGALASSELELELWQEQPQYCEHKRMHNIIYCNYIVGNLAKLLSSLTGSTVDRNKVLLVLNFGNKIFH